MISLWRTIFSYPQVWIGVFLAFLTVHTYGVEKAFALFFELKTYKYLAFIAAGYAVLFEREYYKGRDGVNIFATLFNAVISFYIILFVWGLGVFACLGYQQSGMAYGKAIQKKYNQGKHEDVLQDDAEVLKILNQLKDGDGKKYKIIPNEDGSFVVEVLAD